VGAIVSIELLLDAGLERLVHAEWDALAAAGLPSSARNRSPHSRPHVTLAVRPAIAPFDLEGLDDAFPLQVVLGSPLVFGRGSERILVRSVVPSEALLRLHADLHRRLGAGDDASRTVPGAWTPHVTIARRMPLRDVPRALALIGGELRGNGVGIRRWDSASATAITLVGG
jgi:2'-5' RNA ligase